MSGNNTYHKLDLIMSEAVGKIFAIRDRKNVTQKKLSEMTALPQIAISNFEDGSDIPRLFDLIRLADAIGYNIKIELEEK